MTDSERQEAIKIIKSECYISDLLDLDRTRMVNTALDMAVKVLENEPCWIPVGKRLPNVGDTYIVTIEYKGAFEGVDAADFVFTGDGYIDGKWDTLNDWIEDKPEFYHVTAWMPLPEPMKVGEEKYKDDDEDNYDEDEELVESLLSDFEGALERIDKQNN